MSHKFRKCPFYGGCFRSMSEQTLNGTKLRLDINIDTREFFVCIMNLNMEWVYIYCSLRVN
jgi:hypothetical protein